jgi:hypothetical protein
MRGLRLGFGIAPGKSASAGGGGLPFLNNDIFTGRTASDTNPDTIESGSASVSYSDALNGGAA